MPQKKDSKEPKKRKSEEVIKAFHENRERFDPQGMYKGEASSEPHPVQDADDL